MALKKKNVFQGFIQEDYVPSADQQVVKYLSGKGNNLHSVECLSGTTFLVSMPKKFRQTVWLKKGDCVVIDPISEGKKVLGEIVCLIPTKDLISMIKGGEWLPSLDDHHDGRGDADKTANNNNSNNQKEVLISFYSQNSTRKDDKGSESMMPPSESEEEEEEDDSDDEDAAEVVGNDCNSSKGDVEVKVGDHFEGSNHFSPTTGSPDEDNDDGFTSRVQFLTSGAVTVTSVVNDMASLPSNLQSLDFEAEEDSSLENSSSASFTPVGHDGQDGCRSGSLHKKANTIRIQVNFPPDE